MRIHGAVLAGAAACVLVSAGCGGGTAEVPDAPSPIAQSPSPAAEGRAIRVYVANESSDIVSELVYMPGGALEPVREVPVGIMPGASDGPHGLRISPRGDYWYVSLAHGTPYGRLLKFRTDTNELVGGMQLGLFPASMDIAPGGDLLFIVNFNLHGDPVPSSVSIVHTPTMSEVARLTTCVMPHGSRINTAGTKHYSTCMHSEQLVEIDTGTLEVTRRFSVMPGHEGSLELDDTGVDAHGRMTHDGPATPGTCAPTWAQPSRGARADRFVYVPCNRRGEVLEIDLENDRVSRRFPTGRAPYNVDVTPDGRLLLITLKQEQAVQVVDLESGAEVARIPTTRSITHGLAISPDGRYAFVSNEAVGATRSTVDVIDLRTLTVVASAEVHHQAGGIDAQYR